MDTCFGEYSLHPDLFELRHCDSIVELEPQVFNLLNYLAANRDRVISKDELIEVVWNGRIVSDEAIASRISSARRAVGDDGKAQHTIKTISRIGFRFVADVFDDPKTVSASQFATPKRVSDLLCMSNSVHASKPKEHEDNDNYEGSFRRAAERR